MVYSLPNGSLIFYPFTAEKYRHEIHSTIYRQVIILGAASLFRYYYLFTFLSGKCLLIIASQCKMLTAELLPFFYHSLQFALFSYSHSIIFSVIISSKRFPFVLEFTLHLSSATLTRTMPLLFYMPRQCMHSPPPAWHFFPSSVVYLNETNKQINLRYLCCAQNSNKRKTSE